MGKKLTYRALTNDDPDTTTTHGVSFEAGKSTEVPDHVYEALKDNPWFSGSKDAQEQAAVSPSVGDGAQPDSSVNVAYPPGVGSKTHPDLVKTGEGMVAPDSQSAQESGNEVAQRARGRPRSS